MDSSLWLKWSTDPVVLIGIPVAGILYARGLQTLKETSRSHHFGRIACFYIGLSLLFIALVSPLDYLSSQLFLAHMTQHMILIFFAVPALQIGAPLIPILRGTPKSFRKNVLTPVITSLSIRYLLRLIFKPLIAWPFFIGSLAIWHFPFAFEAAIESDLIHFFEHFVFVAGAYAWWWNIIDPFPLRSNLSKLAKVPYVFITIVPGFVLGSFLTFAPAAWYETYNATTLAYGVSALEDQQIGGLIMWIPGSFVIATALLLALRSAVRAETIQQLQKEAVGK